MAGVVLLARETGRAGRAAAALGWAAVALLVADPGLVADAGFQLSTLATAGLIAWGTAATERIDRWIGRAGAALAGREPGRVDGGPARDAADRRRRRSGGWRSSRRR